MIKIEKKENGEDFSQNNTALWSMKHEYGY